MNLPNMVTRGIPRNKEPRTHVVDADVMVFALPPDQRGKAVKAAQRLSGSVFVTAQSSKTARDVLHGLACVRYGESSMDVGVSGVSDACRSLGDAVVKAMRLMEAQPGTTAFVGNDQAIVEQFGMGHVDPAAVLGNIAMAVEVPAQPR